MVSRKSDLNDAESCFFRTDDIQKKKRILRREIRDGKGWKRKEDRGQRIYYYSRKLYLEERTFKFKHIKMYLHIYTTLYIQLKKIKIKNYITELLYIEIDLNLICDDCTDFCNHLVYSLCS